MKWIKAHWRELLIVLLLILFMNKCTSNGNYKRKYNRQVAYTEYAVDSLKNVYDKSSKYIDSLNSVIDKNTLRIKSLESQLEIYKDQNTKLNDANNRLANKPVIVKIDKEKEK